MRRKRTRPVSAAKQALLSLVGVPIRVPWSAVPPGGPKQQRRDPAGAAGKVVVRATDARSASS